MDIFQTALLVAAVIVAAINYNQKRVLIWIAAGAVDFVLTDAYFYIAPPALPHPFVTGVADATLVILIATFGATLWERLVRYCFMASIFVSISFLWGWIPDETNYAKWLEICNYAALLIMGGTGILRLADDWLGWPVGQVPRTFAGRNLRLARNLFDKARPPTGVIAKAFGQGSEARVT